METVQTRMFSVFRGPGGSQHDSSSPYKRSRPQSPSSTSILTRQGPAYYSDPRFGMAVAAVAAGGYGSIYRDPFQPVSTLSYIRGVQLVLTHLSFCLDYGFIMRYKWKVYYL